VTDLAFALTLVSHHADGFGSTLIIWCRRAGPRPSWRLETRSSRAFSTGSTSCAFARARTPLLPPLVPCSCDVLHAAVLIQRAGVRCAELPSCGWHMSFFGGGAAIKAKLKSYSHQEWNRPDIVSRR
jgi:hypothetical protein